MTTIQQDIILELTARHGLEGLGLYVYMNFFKKDIINIYDDEFLQNVCEISGRDIDIIVKTLIDLGLLDLKNTSGW